MSAAHLHHNSPTQAPPHATVPGRGAKANSMRDRHFKLHGKNKIIALHGIYTLLLNRLRQCVGTHHYPYWGANRLQWEEWIICDSVPALLSENMGQYVHGSPFILTLNCFTVVQVKGHSHRCHQETSYCLNTVRRSCYGISICHAPRLVMY